MTKLLLFLLVESCRQAISFSRKTNHKAAWQSEGDKAEDRQCNQCEKRDARLRGGGDTKGDNDSEKAEEELLDTAHQEAGDTQADKGAHNQLELGQQRRRPAVEWDVDSRVAAPVTREQVKTEMNRCCQANSHDKPARGSRGGEVAALHQSGDTGFFGEFSAEEIQAEQERQKKTVCEK